MNNVVRTASLRANPNPVDPDVKVPEAVKRAAAAAEAAQLAAYPDQAPTPATPTNSDTITIAPNPVTPPAPAPAPVTPEGNPPPAPQPAPQPAPPAPAADDQSWEHKFNSERGRHARTQALLQQTTDRLSSLERMVEELRSAPAPTPAPAPAPTPSQLITAEEKEQFGDEMIDVMGRRAREIVSPELAELRNQLTALEGKLTGTTTTIKRNARAEMLTTLDTRVPTWREINNLPEFKAWLALPDPYFGVIRHNALLEAYEQNDTPRVLNFFKGFVSELAATTPVDDPSVIDQPAPQPAKPSLETLAAPGRARTPAHTNAPAEKQIITTDDVKAFYAAKRRGDYRGREEEFNALERELFKAQSEGRVRTV